MADTTPLGSFVFKSLALVKNVLNDAVGLVDTTSGAAKALLQKMIEDLQEIEHNLQALGEDVVGTLPNEALRSASRESEDVIHLVED